jgi:NitT/TauT family transport system substrate-binding protein
MEYSRRNIIKAGAVIAGSVPLLAACARSPDKVRMGYLPMISSLAYFVAVDQNYFQDENIEVEGIPIQTSDNIAKSLANNDIDLAIELSVVPLLKLIGNDGKADTLSFQIFSHSLIDETNGFDSVLVKQGSEVTDWRALSGKTIGSFPGSTAEKTILDVFRRDFGDIPPPKIIPKTPSLHLAALENGEVDAIHTYEPFLTQGLVIHRFRRVRTSLYAAQMPLDVQGKRMKSPIGVAALNKSWAAKMPVVAASAVKALDRATEFIKRYPDKARSISARFTATKPEVAAAMNIMPMTKSSQIDRVLMVQYLNVLQRIGEIPQLPNLDTILRST